MSSIIAGTVLGSGLVHDSDTTGNLQIKVGGGATTSATFHSNTTTVFSGNVYARNISTDFGIPPGTVIHVAMDYAPVGYLKANGAEISRTAYPRLFAAIGTMFGVGDTQNTFNLPDLRGEFVRSWDDSRGVDSGRAIGSSQTDDFKSHTHVMPRTLTDLNVDARFDAVSRYATSDDADYTDRNTGATGGTETRPRNIALLACIKY